MALGSIGHGGQGCLSDGGTTLGNPSDVGFISGLPMQASHLPYGEETPLRPLRLPVGTEPAKLPRIPRLIPASRSKQSS